MGYWVRDFENPLYVRCRICIVKNYGVKPFPDTYTGRVVVVIQKASTESHKVINVYDFSNFPATKDLVVFCLTTTGRIRKMKKSKKNITIAMCCATICAAPGVAHTAVGCLTVPSTSASSAPAYYSSEWSRGDNYGGIATCTDSNQGTHVDHLNIKLTADATAHCYCKMLRPQTSKWRLLYAAGSGSSSSCAMYCAQNCWGTAPSDFTF